MDSFSRMVDLHCHYLPGVDDGAANLREGLELVSAACANGIDRIVLTPHIHVGRYANTHSSLRVRFETFRRAIISKQIPVEIALAAEVRCSDDLIGLIERDEVPFLLDARGNKTLLLEMPHSHVPAGVEQLLRWLLKRDIRPLLVHPERNKELIAHPQRVADLCKAGCLTQITAAAVVGRFGEKSQCTAQWLLHNNLVTIIATDAHNLQHRPPLLREAAQWVAQRFGEEHAWRLVGARSAALSAGNFRRAVRKSAAAAPMTVRTAPSAAKSAAPAVANKDFCERAFSQLRAMLLGRAAQAGRIGSKAAKSLTGINNLNLR